MAEKSGVHLTGVDSGWPVAQSPEPQPFKDGTGADPHAPADSYADGDFGSSERQSVTVDGTGGTYTLTFSGQTTAAIAFDASAAALDTALEALSNIGAGDLTVTGGPGNDGGDNPYIVTFGGSLAGEDVAALTADDALLTGGGSAVTIATVTPGD